MHLALTRITEMCVWHTIWISAGDGAPAAVTNTVRERHSRRSLCNSNYHRNEKLVAPWSVDIAHRFLA